jgi:multidrug efflux pump subunit AcrB
MNITRAAIEKNRITTVALILVAFGGMNAYRGLTRAEDPGFIVRVAMIVTYFPGASPPRVEQLVTDKIEEVVMEMPELDFVSSESKTGVSVIFVNIKKSYRTMRPIWDDLRRKIDEARPTLPEGTIGPIVNDEMGDVFGTIVTVTGEGFNYAELKDVADDVRDEVLRLPDVAKVEVHGAQEERIFVEYSNARLAELGLSPGQLRAILEARNIIIPGGSITTGDERISLEPSGNFESVEDLRRSVINLPGRAEVVYLEDIASVERGYVDPPQSRAYSSGVPALALAISMRQPGYVDRKVDNFVRNLLQAVGIVALVMLVTLGLRTGVLVASLVPMTILMSFMVMSFFDVGLDQVSLAALIIALGMLVDNAIVMSESIMVQMASGKGRLEAAVDSANELRIPLLTSSLTTAAAFLPIFLAESDTGEYTAPLFKVVTIALLSSWVLSLTMIPLLCFRFMKVKSSPERQSFDSPFYRRYREFLVSSLRHRWRFLGAVVAIFVVAMFGFRFVPNIFFPPSDRALLTAELEMPLGTPIERTEQVVNAFQRFLADSLMADSAEGRVEGVVNWSVFVGQGAPNYLLAYTPEPSSPNYAYAIVNTTSRGVVDEIIPKIERFTLDRFPDLTAIVKPAAIGPPIEAPVQVRISGRDPEELFALMDAVKEQLRGIPGARSISDDWGQRTKKLFVDVSQPRARRAGISSRDIAVSLQTVLSGFETTQYREDDKVIPVVMRSVAADREDLGKVESLNIYAQATGQSVPLKQVADLKVVWEPSKILRRNRQKTVTVSAELVPGVTAAQVNARLVPWLEDQSAGWPLGYLFEIGGEAETSIESQRSIGAKLPIAVFIIIILLVGQFNSVRRPLIIMLTIPLGLIGVVIGLLVTGSYFGFMTLLGVIALAGIVINNAIVLLDRIRIEIDENGLEPSRAVVEAAQRRMRPILLTTMTTVGGLLPLWLGGGVMFEPMAIAILFGLLFATVLTLGVVPVLYSLFFRVSYKGFQYS